MIIEPVRQAVQIVVLLILLCSTGNMSAQEPLTFGVHPYLPATELLRRFSPLADHLSEHIAQPVQLRIASDYQTHIREVGKDRLDIAYLGPAPYVKMVEAYGRKPVLARLEVLGVPFFRGAIVTRNDSPIEYLSELEGTRFAFGDRFSTMSHLVPRYVLWTAGVDTAALSEFEFLGSHHNVALGVLIGDFEAGAVKEEVVARYAQRGLRVLATTPPISEHLFVTRNTMAPAMVTSLRQGLYELNKDSQGRRIIQMIKATATGLVPVSDKDYDNLRDIFDELRNLGVQF